jgi:antitoxin HigA-1
VLVIKLAIDLEEIKMTIHRPLHPRQIIRDILVGKEVYHLSITELSEKLGINRTTLSRLINSHAAISVDMALGLSKLLPDTDMVFWMNLQRNYDISITLKGAVRINVKALRAA